jgi:iron complex transport system substrate-binding protein
MNAKILLLAFIAMVILLCVPCTLVAQSGEEALPRTPLDMEQLKAALSYVRGTSKVEEHWPKTIQYIDRQYDFRSDTFSEHPKTYLVQGKPSRIIPHAVGVTEILWAICPRERLVAFNEFSADPAFCFLADLVKQKGPLFKTQQTELVLGYKPDLVFTVFYSSIEFKEKLKQAKIPFFDLGYFGTIDSIQYQISLIGKVIGEEANASELVRIIDEKTRDIRAKIPKLGTPLRILYYDENGYVPGKNSNFTSICEIIGAMNVGDERGVKCWSQIDYETLLKWDPDVIIVPEGSNLKKLLMTNEILSHAKAVKGNRVCSIPGIYLRVDSQYMLLSANILAGIVYETSDRAPR